MEKKCVSCFVKIVGVLVAYEGLPLHLALFPKLWTELCQTQVKLNKWGEGVFTLTKTAAQIITEKWGFDLPLHFGEVHCYKNRCLSPTALAAFVSHHSLCRGQTGIPIQIHYS